MSEGIIWHISATILATFALVDFFLLIWIIIHSRRWTAPVHAALISHLQSQVDILKSRTTGTQEELLEFKHEYLDVVDKLWKELQTNSESMRSYFREMDNKLDRIDADIKGPNHGN